MPYLGDLEQWADIFLWTEAGHDVKWITEQLQKDYYLRYALKQFLGKSWTAASERKLDEWCLEHSSGSEGPTPQLLSQFLKGPVKTDVLQNDSEAPDETDESGYPWRHLDDQAVDSLVIEAKGRALHPRTVYRYAKRCRERLDQATNLSTDKLTIANISGLGLSESELEEIQRLRVEMDGADSSGTPTWPFAKVIVGESEADRTVSGTDITVNEAKWYIRLKPLSGGLEKPDLVLLAAFCDYKERSAAALDKSEEDIKTLYEDVEKYLAFKPWMNEKNHKDYMRALIARTVRPLDYIALMATSFWKIYDKGNGINSSEPKQFDFKGFDYGLPGFDVDYPGDIIEYIDDEDNQDYEKEIADQVLSPTPLQLLALAKIEFYRSSRTDGMNWQDIPPFQYDYSGFRGLHELKGWDYLWDESLEELEACLPSIPEPDQSHIQEFMDQAGRDDS